MAVADKNNETHNEHNDHNELIIEINKLSIELQFAKETIADLQNQLDSRETELRITKDKQQASFQRRSRRRKISMGFLNPNIALNTSSLTGNIFTLYLYYHNIA